ncbi:hypothetical protein [Paracoccus benzoatiresistens]|uniref:Uncharacterized protein n=1 Tax=Paracoccus benzoatiresistens TaxID=2997341 RepID=A0ABT4J0L2_9RHOB|nr:hypothetical protein [Paracoccus sp. EF6]MCZ0960652.1 hypothetical protein [Paracoccus sp. EF6]
MTRHESFAAVPAADVLPVTPRIGAEIRNIPLSADLPAETQNSIKVLLLHHKVLCFRASTALTAA